MPSKAIAENLDAALAQLFAAHADGSAPPGGASRAEVAAQFGISEATIARMERKLSLRLAAAIISDADADPVLARRAARYLTKRGL